MSSTLGVDNRRILPPFMPATRGEDTIFGLTLMRCIGDAFMGHLPMAMLHVPVETRQFAREALWLDAGRVALKHVLWCCIASAPFGPTDIDDESRIRSLGRRLVDLGSLPEPEFREARGAPGIDRRDAGVLGRRPAALSRHVAGGAAARGLWRPGRRSALARELVRSFGELLAAWPALVESARRLHAAGVTLVEPV